MEKKLRPSNKYRLLFKYFDKGFIDIFDSFLFCNYKYNLSNTLYYSCKVGKFNIIIYIVKKYKNKLSLDNLNKSLFLSCYNFKENNVDIFEFLMKNQANNVDAAFVEACKSNNLKLIMHIIKKYKIRQKYLSFGFKRTNILTRNIFTNLLKNIK